MSRKIIIALALAAFAIVAAVVLRGRRPAQSAATDSAAGSAAPSRVVPITASADTDLLKDADQPGTLRLEGQVIDAAEKPVAGAIVTLNTTPARMATTDAGGSFQFDHLIGRTYIVVARAGGRAGGPAVLRLTATSEPVTLRLQPAARVEVTVVGATDKRPVGGAQVELRGNESLAASTGSDGKVVFDGVAAGGYTIAAFAPGFAKSFTRLRVSGQFVAAGVVEQRKLELRTGAPVSGRVVATDGQPVGGAVVTWASVSSFEGGLESVTADGGGNFRFEAMPAGTFRFLGRHEAHGPGQSQPVTLDGQSERKGIEVKLESGALVDGRVVAKDGKPVPWAMIRVGSADRRGGFQAPRQTFADKDGNFKMTGLARKTVNLVAIAENASSDTYEVDLAATPETHDLVVKLEFDQAISGTVVDARKQPVPDVSVWAMQRGGWGGRRLRGPATDRTDMGGRFTLRGLSEGTYMLAASRSGEPPMGGPRQRSGTTAEAGDTNVELVLESGGSVKGRVMGADGHAPPFFTVKIGRGQAVPFGSGDGSFLVEDVPPGAVTLVVGALGFDAGQAQTTVVADQVADVGTITLHPGRTISGRVLTSDNQPVPGANVYGGAMLTGDGTQPGGTTNNLPWGNAGSAPLQTTSDDQGHFVLAGVGASDLVLVADHETMGRSRAVSVPAQSDSTTVDLTLTGFASLDGVVTQDGKPADTTVVTATSQSAPDAIYTVTTGPDGTFRFDKLAADSYRVSAMGRTGGRGRSMHSSVVTLVPGQNGHVAISFDSLGVTLVVTAQAADGSPVASLVFVVDAAISAANAKVLRAAIAASSATYNFMTMTFGGRPARATGVKAGNYTVCAVPLPAGVGGPGQIASYIATQGDKLPAFCQPKSVSDDTAEQSIAITVTAPPTSAPVGGR